jgi:hypothetical protein
MRTPSDDVTERDSTSPPIQVVEEDFVHQSLEAAMDFPGLAR